MQKWRKDWRIVGAAIFAVFMVILSVYTYNLIQSQHQEILYTLYQSPGGCEYVDIGNWTYGAFQSPVVNYEIGVEVMVQILDWGEGPSKLLFIHGCEAMSLAKFEHLSDSEIEIELDCKRHNITPDVYRFGGLTKLTGGLDYVWAFRFLDSGGNIVPGTLKIEIEVIVAEWIYD
jgi:hypothetical protein